MLDEAEAAARAGAYLDADASKVDSDITAAIAFPAGGIEIILQSEVGLTLIGIFLEGDTVPMRVRAFSIPGERPRALRWCAAAAARAG